MSDTVPQISAINVETRLLDKDAATRIMERIIHKPVPRNMQHVERLCRVMDRLCRISLNIHQ